MWQPDNLTATERRAWETILKSVAPGKHAARNAVFHLERARQIVDIDPNMAIFRAITAEEEAARALFHALERRRYATADRLHWRNHKHKAAVVPFLEAVGRFVSTAGFIKPELVFDHRAGDPGQLRVRFKVPDGKGGHVWVYPDPPLNFRLAVDDKLHDFQAEVESLLSDQSVATFDKFVRERANHRNRLLYATAEGIPRVDGDIPRELAERRETAFSVLAAFLLVDTVTAHQPFVAQLADAFARLMDLIPELETD